MKLQFPAKSERLLCLGISVIGLWCGLLGSLGWGQPSTLLYYEGFETNGWNGWTNDTQYTLDTNFAWIITMPTNGPGSAHQGTNCAATYNAGTDCYLVSPPLYLPEVNQYSNHLWLYYWQWQHYSNTLTSTCLSDVKIRDYQPLLGAWGPWNVIDPGTSGLIAPVQPSWRRRGIDLTLFNNDIVQLGFAHHGLGDPGWFVDDVEIRNVAVLTNVPPVEGFEAGWGFWFNDRYCSWEIGIPTGGGPLTVPEGVCCAGTGIDGFPPAVGDGNIWTPAFYLPSLKAGERAYLQFDQWWDFEFGGMAFVDWTYWFPGVGWYFPQYVSYEIINNPRRTWGSVAVDVSSLAGTPMPIRLGLSYYGTSGLGWFVDRVQVVVASLHFNNITREGNNIHLAWAAFGGTTNVVQCSATPAGTYTNLSPVLKTSGSGPTTLDYLHAGGATNSSAVFYRIRQM